MSDDSSPSRDRLTAAGATIPVIARLAHEISKPKDWQSFQRNCVLLFQAELGDPNAQEYGRSGQRQRGIDVLGKRNNDPDHYVGVQCRRIANPLKKAAILQESRAALEIKANLKEIIFATTAPNDTGATDAAVEVEAELRAEGHDIRVAVYGWDTLQTKIAVHPVAYAAFCPSIVATSAPQAPTPVPESISDFASRVAVEVVAQFRKTGVAPPPGEAEASGSNAEDPALHAQIDTYRDLFAKDQEPLLAEKGLLALESERLLDRPWARFRIETNLGSIALRLGREAEAAARYEAAYEVRRDDPKAVANLALARVIQGRLNEAIKLAQEALDATPRADHAVGYLLQAAARSHWQGDPESLIPPDLAGSEHADVGLAEFLRLRGTPGWAERVLDLSRRHPTAEAFKLIHAQAVLAVVAEANAFLAGGKVSVSADELRSAAEDMKRIAERCLDFGYADDQSLFAFINNAAALLRQSGQLTECEALLTRGLSRTNEPVLRRALAVVQGIGGRRTDALATLATADDPESQLLRAEFVAADDPAAGLRLALAIDATTLDALPARLRWHLIGDLALRNGDAASLKKAVAGLRSLNPADVSATLFEIDGERKAGASQDVVRDRLRALAASLATDADMVARYLVAEALRAEELHEEASLLLEGHVDISRRSPATRSYIYSLAAARRDDALLCALAAASPAVRNDPEILAVSAAHAWNVGDLAGSARAADALLRQQPDHPWARLLKIEILIRQDRSADLLAELDKPIENLAWRQVQHQFRIASLLGHFGYAERAAALAYRLFLEHRDESQAWMTLSLLVLDQGRGDSDARRPWDVTTIGRDVAVNLHFDDGEEAFFVVEADAHLRKLDEESWEAEHPLVQAVMGLTQNARFVGPDGRAGQITLVRHKYVARLHYVMEHHEERFPAVIGFHKVPINVKQPGGLDELMASIKAKREWVEQEEEQYREGPWPLGALAHRVGVDVIEAAGGLAANGTPLKVAAGNEAERKIAVQAILENAGKGCVLDLLAFWTGWRLKALDAITATCGRIHLPQSVIDDLRVRRLRFEDSGRDTFRVARYEGGKLVITEVAPNVIAELRDDVEQAVSWAQAKATICPMVAREDLPAALREHLRIGGHVFDSLVLAIQTELLLVTDDLPTREFNRLVGHGRGAWLHQVFSVAANRRNIDLDTYVRWSAALVDAGHNYLGMPGWVLARAALLDAGAGEAPGHLFKTLIKVIGGRNAEPLSHVSACNECLRHLWLDTGTLTYRQPATGLLLSRLIDERFKDYVEILRSLLWEARNLPDLVSYIHDFARGHFILDALMR